MSIVDNTPVDAATTNAALASKTANNTLQGVQSLANTNPSSGDPVTNVQQAINETFDAVGVDGVNDVDRKNYSSNEVITDGDNHKEAITKLDAKFALSGGHSHSGNPGDGSPIPISSISGFNNFWLEWQNFIFDAASGTSITVSSSFTSKTPGGTATIAGVLTTNPLNRVEIVTKNDLTYIEDAGGQKVYGRLTESGGVWTLSFFTNEAGTETAHTLASQDIRVLYREVFNSANRPTIPSNPLEFGTLDVTGDVVDASSTKRGLVSIGTQSFAGNKTFLDNLKIGKKFSLSQTVNSSLSGSSAELTDPGFGIVKVTNAGLVSISQIANSVASQFFVLVNGTGNEISLIPNAGPTASKNIHTGTITPLRLPNEGSVILSYDDDASSWQVVGGTGSGSGGEVDNLIEFGDAQNAPTSIFVPYADAAGTRPVDGIGGSPTVTTSTSTVEPLSGTKSFLLTKPASNVQGQGWAVPFSVPVNARAKSLKISFDYIINSGTFVPGHNLTTPIDGDVIWYIYDVTNSVLIEPSNIKMFSSDDNMSAVFEATFQTSNVDPSLDSDYRLIAHVSSTSALAFELKINNVKVSRLANVYGATVSDWESYTPTLSVLSGSLPANTTNFKWRRIGDSIDIVGRIQFTATGTWSRPAFTLPPGMVMDSAKLVGGVFPGQIDSTGQIAPAGTPTNVLCAIYQSSTQLYLAEPVGSSFGDINQSTPASFTSSGYLYFRLRGIPVVGLASSSRVSDGYDGREISARITFAAQNIPTGVATKINSAPSVVSDKTGAFNIGTSSFLVQSSGSYKVKALTRQSASSSANVITETAIRVNGTPVPNGFVETKISSSHTVTPTMNVLLPNLKAGDLIDFTFFHNDVGAQNTVLSEIDIYKLSSPQTISEGESLSAQYNTAAGQVVANSATDIISFGTKVQDTHGLVTLSPWRFTANRAMDLQVSFTTLHAAAASSFRYILFKNGVAGPVLYRQLSSIQISNMGCCEISLLAGDYVDIRLNNSSGGSITLNANADENRITLRRMK